MTYYRTVLCSERLPGTDDYYNTSGGRAYFKTGRKDWFSRKDTSHLVSYAPEWWLEPLQGEVIILTKKELEIKLKEVHRDVRLAAAEIVLRPDVTDGVKHAHIINLQFGSDGN